MDEGLKQKSSTYILDLAHISRFTKWPKFCRYKNTLVRLFYKIWDGVNECGYEQRWLEEPRGEEHYLTMAKEAGFREARIERKKNTFYIKLIKN